MTNDALTAKVAQLVADHGILPVLEGLQSAVLNAREGTPERNVKTAWARVHGGLLTALLHAQDSSLPKPEYYGIYTKRGEMMGCCPVDMLDHERSEAPNATFKPITKEQFDNFSDDADAVAESVAAWARQKLVNAEHDGFPRLLLAGPGDMQSEFTVIELQKRERGWEARPLASRTWYRIIGKAAP